MGALTQPLWSAVVNSGGDLKLVTVAGGALNYTKRSAVTSNWLPWAQMPQSATSTLSDPVQRASTYPTPGSTQPHALARVDTTGTGAPTDTFTYETAGNTVRRVTAEGDQTLVWDSEGHLAKSTIAGKDTTFLYDADGNRLLRRDPDATTLYLPGQELKLTKATTQVTGTRYITAGTSTIVKGSDGSLNYLLPDRQNTGQVTVNATTMAYTRTTTTPFGGPRGTQPTTRPTDKGFVGGTTDTSNGPHPPGRSGVRHRQRALRLGRPGSGPDQSAADQWVRLRQQRSHKPQRPFRALELRLVQKGGKVDGEIPGRSRRQRSWLCGID
ncbi:hypothetical protein OG823_26820 [Kitasatospora sp. NBC_00315]